MKQIDIRRYSPSDIDRWNDFVQMAKNGTFLHNRNFMDYHADRFVDYSLIISVNNKWIAVVPANIIDNTLCSHSGLSYGGLLYNVNTKLETIINILKAILTHLHEQNIPHFYFKNIPYIYAITPNDEIKYALSLANAVLARSESLSVIDLRTSFKMTANKLQCIKKGTKQGLTIIETNNFDSFWTDILIPNLQQNHNTLPVHTLTEITLLHQKFPKNIRQFNVFDGNNLVAGATIFETQCVAHVQYISGNDTKSKNGSLDFLFNYLITNVFIDKHYFDFGSSNEQSGKKLNSGLAFWKESFGASTVVQEFYNISTQNHNMLNNFMV